jgi:hypothetical protein
VQLSTELHHCISLTCSVMVKIMMGSATSIQQTLKTVVIITSGSIGSGCINEKNI